MVDESTLNLTVKLHGTTQTHCIVVLQVNDNKIHDCLTAKVATESTTRFTKHIQRENKDLTSLFDNMKASFVTLGNINCTVLNILTN